MGWDFTPGASRADIIREITRNYTTSNGRTVTCVTSHLGNDNTFWSVWSSELNGEAKQCYIRCSLLEASPDGYGWGKKDMEECMGPFYYDCPLGYLNLAPVANEAWRAKVREYWAQRPQRVSAALQAAVTVMPTVQCGPCKRPGKRMPNKEQLAALITWANTHGHTWKAQLDVMWTNGARVNEPYLQQVRNEFGPSWLQRTTLKQIQQAFEEST